jgi:F-type H+-transporting ATPase subunit epsilon
MTSIELHIASLSGKQIKASVKEVYVETADGVVGVLPGHQPEFYSVGAGTVKYIEENGKEGETVVYDGFVQIEPYAVRIGVKDIVKPSEINVQEIKAEIENLKAKIEGLSEEESEKISEIEKEIEKRESLISKATAQS